MIPEHASFAPSLTLEECRQAAQQFLARRGYGMMEANHYQVYDGLAVIHFVAVQDGVLLYPDQVKVQIRMDTGSVVGIECRSYLTHHRPRGSLTPAVTEEEAQGMISDQLRLTGEGKLCLIPLNGQELLCWQFAGEYEGERYLIYINAQTARQEEILKLVETEYGIQAV
jgi:germination protein YpeB